MLATVIAVILGAISFGLLLVSKASTSSWAVVIGVIIAIAVQVVISMVIRKKTKKINNDIQEVMLDGQTKINRQMQNFQRKPQSGVKAMQTLMEREQGKFIKEAIKILDNYAPFYKWNFLLKKQVSTMQMMFYYQLKEYKKVDALMDGCFFVDSRALSFKMARLYKTGGDYDKLFKKKIRKFKAGNAVILYALYSWILVKEKRIDDAITILIEASKRTGEEIFVANHQALVNGKEKKFSNAKLGDMWYALYLENPQMAKQGKNRQRMNQRGF